MNLTELKLKQISDVIDIAESLGLESVARSRKQDLIFAILKKQAKAGDDIYGDGVLEILQDGFGFLRTPGCSYLAVVLAVEFDTGRLYPWSSVDRL